MGPIFKWNVVRIVLTTAYLMIGWLLFTGVLTTTSILVGLGFSFLVSLLTFRFFFEEQDAARRSLLPRVWLLIVFLLLLVFKMYVSSFQVLFNIIRGRTNPRIVHFRTRLSSDIARVLLANSITMTPGTITVLLVEDHLIVHWLEARSSHSRYAGNLIKGDFEKLLKRIFV